MGERLFYVVILASIIVLSVWIWAIDREYQKLKLRLWGAALAAARQVGPMLANVPLEEKQAWPPQVQKIALQLDEFSRLPCDEDTIRAWLLAKREE